MAKYEYMVGEDGQVWTVRRVDDIRPELALNAAGDLWVWEGCNWRRATENERVEHMPEMAAAMERKPTMQRSTIWAPLVSREASFETVREVYG